MKYRVFSKNQNSPLNAMSGDISYEDLSKIEGISTIALKLKLAHKNKKATSFFQKNSSTCALASVKKNDINYKNFNLVTKYLSKRGKITASRINGISNGKQKLLKLAIKRCRAIGLIPAVNYGDYKI